MINSVEVTAVCLTTILVHKLVRLCLKLFLSLTMHRSLISMRCHSFMIKNIVILYVVLIMIKQLPLLTVVSIHGHS